MTLDKKSVKHTPVTYIKRGIAASDLAEQYILEWEKKLSETKKAHKKQGMIPPTICFSRRIGVGALEVADLLAAKTRYRVFDKRIIEFMAKECKLSEKTVAVFDEHYPGKLNEFLSMAFGEKSFIQSDYSRCLFRVVLAIAGLGPAIFVGRGAHLLLPRDRVLSFRFTASMNHRSERAMKLLNIKKEDIRKKLEQFDKEQNNFCLKVYGKSWDDTEHFDLMINFDRFSDPQWACEIVELAFRQRFGIDIKNV